MTRKTVNRQQQENSVGLRRIIIGSVAVLLAGLLGLFGAASAYSQVTGATLSGTITDPSGGVIPGAQLSVTNTATGITTGI